MEKFSEATTFWLDMSTTNAVACASKNHYFCIGHLMNKAAKKSPCGTVLIKQFNEDGSVTDWAIEDQEGDEVKLPDGYVKKNEVIITL